MQLQLTVKVGTPLYALLWSAMTDYECPTSPPIEATIHGFFGRWRIVSWDKRDKPWCTFGLEEVGDG